MPRWVGLRHGCCDPRGVRRGELRCGGAGDMLALRGGQVPVAGGAVVLRGVPCRLSVLRGCDRADGMLAWLVCEYTWRVVLHAVRRWHVPRVKELDELRSVRAWVLLPCWLERAATMREGQVLPWAALM